MSSLSLIGGALVVIAAVFLGKSYSAFIKKREVEGEELLRFLTYIKGEVSRFLATPETLASSFDSEVLSECGFLPLGEGEELCDAFLTARLSLSEEVRKILTEFFSGFGRNYLEAEVSRCEEFCERLGERLKIESEANAKSVRVVKTVSAAAALGTVILLI